MLASHYRNWFSWICPGGTIEIWSPYAAILADCFQTASRIGTISIQHCLWRIN
jgi:hypothetical protein